MNQSSKDYLYLLSRENTTITWIRQHSPKVMVADGNMSFLADQNSHLQPTMLSSKVCHEKHPL